MDAHTDSMLTDEGDLVLETVLNHLVEVLQERDLLPLEELSAGVRGVVIGPERADVDTGRLSHIDERSQAPEQGTVDTHQVLGGQVISFVEDDAYLGFTPLQLAEEHFQLQTHIQLSWIKHHKDQVSAINEPLAYVIEGVAWGEVPTRQKVTHQAKMFLSLDKNCIIIEILLL